MTLLAHGTDFRTDFQRTPKRVVQKLQGMFFEMLLKELKSDMPGSELGDVPGGSMMADLMSQALATKLSRQVDLGLGRSLGIGRSTDGGLRPPRVMESGSILNSLPVNGRITSPYGFRRDPINGERRFHHGVDIAAPVGSPLRSSMAGKVVFAGEMGGYGKVVKVRQADGVELILGHCSKLLVETGDEVGIGQKVAEVGSTGRSTGPHVHLEVRYHGTSIDPLNWLSRRTLVAKEKPYRADGKNGSMSKPGS